MTDGSHWTDWTLFTYPFNLTRQPAATVPCGLTSAGLPAGLQIIGPSMAMSPSRRQRLREAAALAAADLAGGSAAFARARQRAAAWTRRRSYLGE
jgi:hypothetical protein